VSQVLAILGAKARMGRHQVASVRNESRLKVAVISVSAVLLWLGAFALFHAAFRFLLETMGRGAGEFDFGGLLMSRLLNILGLSVFFLLIFSNVLVCFSTMYRSKEVVYLVQAPITFEQFFYARFAECVSFSSWSLAYLGSPLIIAYGLNTEASPAFYLAALLFFVPFVTLPACLGCALTMVLVRVFPRLKTRVMILLSVLAVVLFFLYIASIIRSTRISDETILPAFLNASQRMQSPFLPSTWAADGVLAAAHYQVGTALFYFALLVSSALMALWLTGQLAQWMFYPGWSYLMGQDRQRIRKGGGIMGLFERAMRFAPEPYRTLAIKDVKLFWRDPTQWSQFIIFFGIMGIYIANLKNTSQSFEKEIWRSWVASLNVGAVSLILATLTSRFVFPLVSLEGRRFWILGLAPLTYRQLVWQKFWLSVVCTSFFTVGLALLSGYMLALAPIYYFLTVYSVAATNFGLSGLAVGLGTLYPTFTEDNPARIVSGMGGTLNLLVSIGYITIVVAAQVVVLQWRILGQFSDPSLFPIAITAAVLLITGLSALCVWLPMRLGLRNLEQMEF
jgi:ABC-2 type transport system permease protein